MSREPLDVDRSRARSRRPLTDAEIPFAVALGALLRSLRIETGYSATDLAFYSEMTRQHLHHLENATRRTRASTLARIAESLAMRLDMSHKELTNRLIAVAGIALAPPANPEHQGRIDKRRKERVVKAEKRAERHALYGPIVRELRRQHAPERPQPLRGPDGRWLPNHPTPEQVTELERRYKWLALVMPPRDANGDFIKDSPYLDNRTARAWFNPPKRYPGCH